MLRYGKSHNISSQLDPIQDLFCLLQYITAKEYLVELLQRVHGLSATAAESRSKLIIPHAATALDYLRDGLKAKEELSFLSLYYGLLNLSKVYVLLGQHYDRLKTERSHGVSYNPNGKDSRTLLTETIKLNSSGAIPLFYETLTGCVLPSTKKLALSDILPYVTGVGAEYALATGKDNNIHYFDVKTTTKTEKAKTYQCVVTLSRRTGDTTKYSRKGFRGLKRFRVDPQSPDIFKSPSLKKPARIDSKNFREQFNGIDIYSCDNDGKKMTITTPHYLKRIHFPEEFPILLLFFYMSSIVRYRPEYLMKLRNSKYWPILSAARQHCIFRMLTLAWSFVHKKELLLEHS